MIRRSGRLRLLLRDDGYALIAALTAVLAFTLLAFEILSATRGDVAMARAEMDRARLAAAADAGLAMALAGLNTDDATTRWSIDGRSRQTSFEGTALSITVEDERGKIPINLLNEDQVRSMFEMAGASGERLDTLVDSFEDWIDDDTEPRPHGAENDYYAPKGIAPRNGAFRTVDELEHIKGMDSDLYARLAPSLTVNFGESGGFSPRTAQPLALAVMSGSGLNSPAVIQRQRELAGQRPVLDSTDDTPLAGRILTIRIVASDSDGGNFVRTALVELTGNDREPYWIRG